MAITGVSCEKPLRRQDGDASMDRGRRKLATILLQRTTSERLQFVRRNRKHCRFSEVVDLCPSPAGLRRCCDNPGTERAACSGGEW